MNVRILDCSTSIKNYNLCINEKVAGFTRKTAQYGDIVYFAVKSDKKLLCGARALLSDLTDYKPWEDSDRYRQCFSIKNIEYCVPFELNILSQIEHSYWHLLFVRSSKAIKDDKAIVLLDNTFSDNKINTFYLFQNNNSDLNTEDEQIECDDNLIHNQSNIDIDNEQVKIMGTFQTINFYNETDKNRGLETLVNKNFYCLFPFYPEHRTLLISDNRKFITSGLDNSISGIRGIPDGLLIVFNKELNNPFQINLIEYECYGEQKIKSIDKFNHLNCHIIPQLMRFASTFSIVTDQTIREQTIKSWTEKVIDYIYSDILLQERITSWVKELIPLVKEQKIALEIQSLLLSAFKTNLRIILIIDELSSEQKDTIKNIIQSFKLESNKGVEFTAYVVRLEQKVSLIDTSLEYALSFQ